MRKGDEESVFSLKYTLELLQRNYIMNMFDLFNIHFKHLVTIYCVRQKETAVHAEEREIFYG